MMRTLVVLSVLVVIAAAAPGDRCCLNTTFSFVLRGTPIAGMNTSTPTIQSQTQLFDYDYDRMIQRVVVNGSSIFPPSSFGYSVVIYNDFKHSKAYNVQNGACTEEPLTASQSPHCIPDSFTKIDSYTIGQNGGLKRLSTWSGAVGGDQMIFDVDENCTPITMTTIGSGGSFVSSFLITDVKNGLLSSSDALEIPQACKHGAGAVGK
ncbi:uncharacterized protein LOC127881284 [Dreissena polymorpha]|uniref:Uncharacterized protein n=1 Tax=Dreissena polymorpha TaxID=45954 RepID=A0A9D4MPZ5_DREPO|nr:uncharacterized protein LOC127881284 [Dreissena polymorpha]KAH3881692.1 hypothetical protein DPMN_005619 [Dreissena polymorpha]